MEAHIDLHRLSIEYRCSCGKLDRAHDWKDHVRVPGTPNLADAIRHVVGSVGEHVIGTTIVDIGAF